MEKISGQHELISPTAKLVAYSREFSDIPFAKDVSRLTGSKEVCQFFSESEDLHAEPFNCFAVGLEARYKSALSTIKRFNIKQVLEFASGLSFRGPVMAEDPEIVYVETDLPGMMNEKLHVLSQIPDMRSRTERGNVHFHTVNALSMDEIEDVLHHFSTDFPIAIVHEGFFQYLTMEEKKNVALNFRNILSRFGGVWITPDLNTKADASAYVDKKENMSFLRESIKKHTGRDFNDNSFEDESDLNSFFNDLGFTIKSWPQIDGSFELSSLQSFNLSHEQLNHLKSFLKIWTITLS